MFKALITHTRFALSYSLRIINWSKTDIKYLQQKLPTLLTKARTSPDKAIPFKTEILQYRRRKNPHCDGRTSPWT